MASKNPTLCLAVLCAASCTAQSINLPKGTPLPVQIEGHLPMRVGQSIRAGLIYPVYADNTLILPAKTIITGTVVGLRSDHPHRIAARLRADFTPFYVPVVRFTGITLADGSTLPITTGVATDGAPIYRLVAPPPRKGGVVHQQWDNGLQILRDKISIITGPDKGDRLVQFLYIQLPYHPQRIEKGTAWTVELSEPASLSPQVTALAPAEPPPTPSPVSQSDTPQAGLFRHTWANN